MADIAIHQLSDAAALGGGEMVPIDDGTATRKTTVAALRAGLAQTGHGHAVADVTDLQAVLAAKAPVDSPAFTGTATVAGNPVVTQSANGHVTLSGRRFEVSGITDVNNHGLRLQASAGATINVSTSSTGLVFQRWSGATWSTIFAANADSLFAGANPVAGTNGHLRLRAYTMATLPSAATGGEMILVSDGASGKRLALSDGAAWRWPDGSAVS